jgi:hypothetical protein
MCYRRPLDFRAACDSDQFLGENQLLTGCALGLPAWTGMFPLRIFNFSFFTVLEK